MNQEYFKAFILISIALTSFVSLILLFSNKPSVVVSEKGIKNNTNMMGLIKWKYIDGFETKKVFGREILIILLNDTDEFLSEKNPIVRLLMKTNIKKLGSPAVIGQIEFNEPLTAVIESITTFKNKVHDKV